jgi:hypothetical protein
MNVNQENDLMQLLEMGESNPSKNLNQPINIPEDWK